MQKITRPKGSLISHFSNLVKLNGGINFAQGIPGFNPPIELIEKLKEVAEKNYHQYAPGTGDHLLLETLQKHYYENYNTNFNKFDFQITNGATEAISLIYLYLIKKLTKVNALAFDPVYESYSKLPFIYNQKFTAFPFDSDMQIDWDKLEQIIKSKQINLIFINSPGNPFGKIWTKDEFSKLLNLSEKHNFYVLIDAVYNELYFSNPPYFPHEHFNEKIFYVNSFSKLLSITGWRIGYFLSHPSHMEELRNIHDYTGLSSPFLLQRAIAEYLAENHFGANYCKDLRKKLKSSFQRISSKLKELGFEIPDIDGGYFVWAKLPDQFSDSFDFGTQLYENEKVAIIPGIHFSENYNNYIRINIARNDEEIEQGLKGIEKFITQNG